LEKRGETQAAEQLYLEADARGSTRGAWGVGDLHKARDQLPEALHAYQRMEERTQGISAGTAAFFQGVVYAKLGDKPPAEAAYRRGDVLGFAPATFNLGLMLEEKGDLRGAEAAFSRAATLSPSDRRERSLRRVRDQLSADEAGSAAAAIVDLGSRRSDAAGLPGDAADQDIERAFERWARFGQAG
jgi:tetratricopeptide (TPR) repeat protein